MTKKLTRTLFFIAMMAVYAVVAYVLVFFVSRSGEYPAGADTMFYVYRGDFLYRSITEEGNWYPILDLQWYNGVQTWRYWSPLSAYILAGCQAIMGGSSFDGYLLFVGLLYYAYAMVWLIIGYTHKRPFFGTFMGLIWFFIPNNMYLLFKMGVVARSISMAVMPAYVLALHDWLVDKKWSALPRLIIHFIFVILCHVGWAGMLAITTLIFLLVFWIAYRHYPHGQIRYVIETIILGFVISGILVIPSVVGGVTGIESSQVAEIFFQPLSNTLSPISVTPDGIVSRWQSIPGSSYYGLAAFLLTIFGILFGKRRNVPGCITAMIILLLTPNYAYPLLMALPGGDMLWMTRFVSIALTFLIISFFLWRELKKPIQVTAALLLLVEIPAAFVLFMGIGTNFSPEERYSAQARKTLLDQTKEITEQRLALPEAPASVPDGIYIATGFGGDRKPMSYGQGVQAAVTYKNIVQINQSAEDGQYLYMFDRAKELGNDVVYTQYESFGVDEETLDAYAAMAGYYPAFGDNYYRVYKLRDAPEQFGVISKFRAIGIGRGAPGISVSFPAVEETDSTNLNDYTYEQLSQYDVVYLDGFVYDDREAAEEMILKLTENGVKVVIATDGIPSDEHTGTQSFCGVAVYPITFKNGYPEMETVHGRLNCDLFADGYTTWRTTYCNGLDEVWGYLEDEGQRMDFFGTKHNDNLIYMGLNLTYHYALTQDEAVGRLISLAFDLPNTELPQRTLVPIEIDYHDNVITIKSEYDNVNTTLAYHDIFDSDQEIYMKHNLTYVNAGTTVIKLHYPYLWQGLTVSGVGLLLCGVFLYDTRRRLKKEMEGEGTDGEDEQGGEPADEPISGEPAGQDETGDGEDGGGDTVA